MSDVIYVFSARYAHRRPTAAAHSVVNAILRDWSNISETTRLQLQREAKNEAIYNLDDWQRLIDKRDNR